MAFSDDFTGTAGQVLSARPGWTKVFGDDVYVVSSTGALRKPATSTTALTFYATADDASTVQAAKADLISQNNHHIAVLGSGSTEGTFNAYVLRMQTGGTSCRIYRIVNGVLGGSPILTGSSLGDGLGMELRATVFSDRTEVSLWKNGTQVGSTYSDTSASRMLSGRRGIVNLGTVATSADCIDNYVDNYSAGINIVVADRQSRFVEGVRAASPTLPFSGTYQSVGGGIQARVVDAAGNALSGFDWTTKVASPSGGTFASSFAGLPIGGPYRLQVRDSATPATVAEMPNPFYVGAILILWGQSQAQILSSDTGAAPAVNAAAKVFFMSIDSTQKASPTAPIRYSNVAGTGVVNGSGVAAIANQWHADTGGALPLLIVDITHEGTGIGSWIDPAGQRSGGSFPADYFLYGTTPTNGIAERMMQASDRQASAVMWMQGTANVSSLPGANPDYYTMMGTLGDKWLASMPNANPLFLVQSYHRCCDGPNYTWQMRQQQYSRAMSGGRWRHLIHILDQRMSEGDSGSVHQPGTLDGNVRMGTRIGRGLASHLFSNALDIWGPRAVSAKFTDGSRTAFDVTFDKDIKLADGSGPNNVPGQFVAEDGATWPAVQTGITAAITGARTLRITKTSGAFPAGSRWDMLRSSPYNSRTGDSDNVGTEPFVVTNFLNRGLTDTSSFDGGRGLPASPVMGTGLAIAAAAAEVIPLRPILNLRLGLGLGL